MSCTHLKTCYEAGTTYKDKLLDFPEETTGLTDFRYIVKYGIGETILTLTEGNGIMRIQDNKLRIQSAQLEDLSLGNYSATLFFKINGNDRKLFTEDLEITEDGCDCANIYNLSFSIVPVDITENVVNIYLNWEDLTPEQKEALTGPKGEKGDKGDVTIVEFEVDNDMNLLQHYNLDEVDFELNNNGEL